MFLSMFALASALQASPAQPAAPAAPPPETRPAPPPPRSLAVRARGNLASFVMADDYPAEALRNEEEGTVTFRLSVRIDGRVTDCAITRSSQSASLDETTCRIMQDRARLTPARGPDGRAIEDTLAGRITWRFSSEDPEALRQSLGTSPDQPPRQETPAHRSRPITPLASLVSPGDLPARDGGLSPRGITHFLLTVSADGRVSDCRITESSGSTSVDEVTCRSMRTRARFTPARDASGQVVADQHWGHVHWGGAQHPPMVPQAPRSSGT